VSDKPLGMKQFQVLGYPKELELGLSGPLESFGIGKMRRTTPMEAVGSILAVGPQAKKEIRVYALTSCVWQGDRV
jgi:hypothetical protein